MLTTIHSNRLEQLAGQLAARIYEPPENPLMSDVILVQNSGMARWLSMYLAEQLGVCANVEFHFPGAFGWKLHQEILGDLPVLNRFDKPVLTWRIATLLTSLDTLPEPSLAPLRDYLAADGSTDPQRLLELARRIADVFDQYQVYRPDWVIAWQSGQNPVKDSASAWQATLWQLLCADDKNHRVAQQRALVGALSRAPGKLPARLHMIGIAALAPLQLELLVELSEHSDIALLILNPCRQHWGDIIADRAIARRDLQVDPATLYLEVGNPLLASLGRPGRDFIDLVHETAAHEIEAFVENDAGTLLAHLQNDILDLLERGAEVPRVQRDAGDRSVQVHVCHGPRRELEILHDQLLWLFEHDQQLRPSDIIVMTPDIELYAPLIDAVFGTVDDHRRLPYSIADRSIRSANPLIETLLAVLDLPEQRFETAAMLGVLDDPSVRERFQFDEQDIRQIQFWLQQTQVRWGLDSANRNELQLPAEAANTWKAGLDRLLLGAALPIAERSLYQDILPFDDIEGAGVRVVGRLCQFVRTVSILQQWTRETHTVSQWSTRLDDLIDRLFAPLDSHQESQLHQLRSAISGLTAEAELGAFTATIGLAELRGVLAEQLNALPATGLAGFFSGGITFCTLVPMRSIPFDAVCLIGMNSDRFPRASQPADFDLLASHYRKGDSSRRQDDRYLFLEALLSARQTLYLSYVGRSIHDNSELPPSVLVGELLEIIDRGFESAAPDSSASREISHLHPLTGFSQRYFSNEQDWFSYRSDMATAGPIRQRNQLARVHQRRFFAQPLSVPDATWRELPVGRLLAFVRHPIRFMIQERLGVNLRGAQAPPDSSEPFELDGLDRYNLRLRLLDERLAGGSCEAALTRHRARGELPHGQVGRVVFVREWQALDSLLKRLPEAQLARQTEISIGLKIGEFSLSGNLANISPNGLLTLRPAKITGRDRLTTWLMHLLLCAERPQGIERVSRYIGNDGEIFFPPVDNAKQLLAPLLADYWRALREPLGFFVQASFAYAQACHQNPQKTDQGLKAARQAWYGNDTYPGEATDPYHQLVYVNEDPINAEFEKTALEWLGPLLDQEQKHNG